MTLDGNDKKEIVRTFLDSIKNSRESLETETQDPKALEKGISIAFINFKIPRENNKTWTEKSQFVE